ncbi:PREDICTED: uncharacterized protein LOC106792368 [Polistes canadensis]|uniref:uncharacterized protein LOC106792368 n=1 Tax=Polistes canadensis TaxID=91411 RepID=UPI000718C0C0|nr:PREDICTED: uncharacterized protein LOC106792368 [Polistes canadensis]
MFVINLKGIKILLIMMLASLQSTQSYDSSNTYSFRTDDECPLHLTVLDFLYNFTEPDLEITWPCEARFYWLSLQPFVKFVRFLLSYVTPFIIIVGVILNTVSFAILNAPVSGDSSLSLYLKALAISDNGALIFNYAVGIAKSQFTFVNDLFMNSKFLCDTNSVIMELFQFTSTWLVVSLTWARVFAIIFPFGAHSSNPDRSAIISVTTLTCVSFIISLTKLYSGGYETDSVFEFIPCQKKIKPWGSTMYVYIALSTWLPLTFIFVGNVLLVIHMKKLDTLRRQLTRSFCQKINKTNKRSRTLLAVSMVYLILLLPLGIVETLELYWDVILIKYPEKNIKENKQYINWLEEKMLLKWCRGLFFHLYHWNFACNFFLYYLTGEKFRSVVIQKLIDCKIILTSTKLTKCLPWCKCEDRFKSIRTPSILLIKVVTFDESFVNNNITTENNSNVASII